LIFVVRPVSLAANLIGVDGFVKNDLDFGVCFLGIVLR